jgi:hypothetical protein
MASLDPANGGQGGRGRPRISKHVVVQRVSSVRSRRCEVELTVDLGKKRGQWIFESVMAHFPERGRSTPTTVSPDAAIAGEFENPVMAHGSGRVGPVAPSDGGTGGIWPYPPAEDRGNVYVDDGLDAGAGGTWVSRADQVWTIKPASV